MTHTPWRHAGAPCDVPAVLDIEASGFGKGSYPIEIGFVLPDGGSYCTLIRPAPGWTHWDAQAEQMHRITRDFLIQHGRDVADVAHQLNHRLRGRILYCDAWAYDYAWIGTLFEAAHITPQFKLDSLRALLTDAEIEAWAASKSQVIDEMQLERHRTSSDAKVLQRTLMRLRSAQAEIG